MENLLRLLEGDCTLSKKQLAAMVGTSTERVEEIIRDYEKNNIILGYKAVIDWEFCGRKPPAYDMANLLGCLGMDDPAFLTGPMAMEFLRTLQEAEFLEPRDSHFLPDQIAALRFAWMREWVARKDMAMITQELDFLWLILDNRDLLRKKWTLR